MNFKKIVYYFIQIYLGCCALLVFGDNEIKDDFTKIGCFLIILIIMYLIHKFFYSKINRVNNKNNDENELYDTYDNIANLKSNLNNIKNLKYDPDEIQYIAKSFMTNSEKDFYNKIKDLNNDYIVIPQVSLGSIVHKENSKYRSELFKIIDFGIFSKDFDLLLLIELNDKSHDDFKRKDRDLRLKKILSDCNIKMITFYTKYPNEKEYVINRILKYINNDNINDEATE